MSMHHLWNKVTLVPLLIFLFVEVQGCLHIQRPEGFTIVCTDRNFTTLTLNQTTFILHLSGLSIDHVTEIALQNCTNLVELHLNDNVLTDASEIPFYLLKRLNYVDLSSNKLTKIDKDLFEHNSVLETLMLSGNKLTIKQEEPILISDFLRELILSNCGFHKIFWNTFNKLPKLETLDLSHNNLRIVSPFAFSMTNLLYLTIDETSVQALPQNVCCNQATINVVSKYAMYTLNDSMFCGNMYGAYADPSVDEFSSSSKEIATEIGVLESLSPEDISKEMAPMKLPLMVFLTSMIQHRAVKSCYLTSPRAECSELGLMKVPRKLNPAVITSLDLSKNPNIKLSPIDFGTYTELETLLVSDCNLKQLPEDIFSKLLNLRMVNIARNKLTSIPSNIFEYNKNLSHVILDENGPLMLHSPILITASLEILSISACGIESIHDETFSRMPKLQELDLTRNPLRIVTANAFKNNTLKKLSIYSVNCLKYVAQKLCKDKVFITVDDDSTPDHLCILQYSGTVQTKPNIQTEVGTNIVVFSSEKYTDTGFNQSNTVSSTTPSIFTSPSTKKMYHETISTVVTIRTTDSITKVTTSSPSINPTTQKMLQETTSTAGTRRTTDSITKVTNSSPSSNPTSQKTFQETASTAGTRRTTDSSSSSDDEVIRLRIGKTEVWIISGLIAIYLVTFFTYRYLRKSRKERRSVITREHDYDYVYPHYCRINYDNVHELSYDSLTHYTKYNPPMIVPPPLPPRPPTIRT